MKCPKCDGTGNIANGMWLCCECQGTGFIEDEKPSEPMTNEEYLRSCNTEQLATFLAILQYDGTDLTLKKNHVEKWVEWLKEIHQ